MILNLLDPYNKLKLTTELPTLKADQNLPRNPEQTKLLLVIMRENNVFLLFQPSPKDGLPNWACFECAALLHKFHKFREKCFNGQRVLEHIIQTAVPVSNSNKAQRTWRSLTSNS